MKLRCVKKPRTKITGYPRCKPGMVKGKRNTTKERRAKLCLRGSAKVRVSPHKRRVCHT